MPAQPGCIQKGVPADACRERVTVWWVVMCMLQAMLVPGRLVVIEGTSEALQVNVTLSQQPSEHVTISATVPGAWDGTPMAVVSPSALLFTPDNWSETQVLALQPRPVCDGDYFVSLSLQ